MLDDGVELELQAVEEDLANVDVEDDVSSQEEDGGGRPESRITSSITERERLRSTFVLRTFALVCTREERMANTAKHSTFFRKLCIRPLMKLKSSSSLEGRSGESCRQLFVHSRNSSHHQA